MKPYAVHEPCISAPPALWQSTTRIRPTPGAIRKTIHARFYMAISACSFLSSASSSSSSIALALPLTV